MGFVKDTYDQKALEEIHKWKKPVDSWFGRAGKAVNWPLDKAGDAVMETPGVGEVIKIAVSGMTSVCNDVSQWSVRSKAIIKKYQGNGFSQVQSLEGVFDLNLENCDRTVGYLGAKYKVLAVAEGAGTGALGLPGIPANLIAILTLNLRAIGEYATYYGFDIQKQHERLFAMNLLRLASSPTDAKKMHALTQLVNIAQKVAKKAAWKELEKSTFVKIIQQISKVLGIRLTKAKLAQIIPGISIAIGAGFDVYYTTKVCDAAYYLYRERFLAEKYGPAVIEATVKPSGSLIPEYSEDAGEN